MVARAKESAIPMPPIRSKSPPPAPKTSNLPPMVLKALARKSVLTARQRRSDMRTYTDSLHTSVAKSPGHAKRQQATEENGPCYHYEEFSDRNYMFDSEDQQLALALYPDSVGQLHDVLVPKKTTDTDFWERYFFRCSEKAIFQELQRQQENMDSGHP